MYMYVVMCIFVYGPGAVYTINELNWTELHYSAPLQFENNFLEAFKKTFFTGKS